MNRSDTKHAAFDFLVRRNSCKPQTNSRPWSAMPRILFVQSDGSRVDVEVPAGDRAMRAAFAGNVDGIVAECGGSAMCATCHVYVDERFLGQLPKMSLDEDALLDSTASARKPNSRLSCQIPVEDTLDGIVLTIPPSQV